jgi:tRNA(Ile)-lysidine synthase
VTGPDPAVAAVRSAVRREFAGARLAAGDLVIVACSGGADSLALAAAAAFVAPRAGLRVGAVVVDHRWHAASAAVAERAAATCRELGLDPVEVVVAAPDGDGGGPEAVARRARYAALDQTRGELGAACVLLGHTREDQAETVLLGLLRGSGARSLAGMPRRRGPYLRPLLDLPRSLTRQACAALGLEPWDDPANADPRYARVRARDVLARLEEALGPGLGSALARTAEQLREDADALDAAAAALVVAAADQAGGLSCEVLAPAPDAVRRRALLAAARAAGAPAGALSRRHALALDGLVAGWHGQGTVHLPGGVLAGRRCGTLWFARRGSGDHWNGEQEDRAGE